MGDLEPYDYLFKLIIIGDSGTGKSCLLHNFLENKFKKGSSHTIGVEFGAKVITLHNKTIKLQIWDTAGQERFRSVTRSYYRGAAGAVILYDITNEESFNHVSSWLTDARTLGRPDITILTAGNKSDLKDNRAVAYLDASKFAQENDVQFLETSALTSENVEEAFLRIAKLILGKIESGDIDPQTITPPKSKLDPKPTPPNRCCSS
mmetsp:Transcript_43841/g.50433  ORF Transcript_43841/g.50433 Transcript_43841/m.50433 type:complete len:206 (-) Transcript_43841:117-734(-)